MTEAGAAALGIVLSWWTLRFLLLQLANTSAPQIDKTMKRFMDEFLLQHVLL